jgi:hypothetical protein
MKSITEGNMTKIVNKESILGRLEQLVWAALSTNTVAAVALVFLQTASQASAATFSFSTGAPDGKIATLSTPSIPGKIQTLLPLRPDSRGRGEEEILSGSIISSDEN